MCGQCHLKKAALNSHCFQGICFSWRGRLAQDSCLSRAGSTGAGCFIWMRNGPWRVQVQSAPLPFISVAADSRLVLNHPCLMVRVSLCPADQSVGWGQSGIPRVTLAQKPASAFCCWLWQGSGQNALACLSPNLCNLFRAAIHSQFYRVWIHLMWLWAAEITHPKHGALPPVPCSRSWQGWIGQCCTEGLAPVAFLLLKLSGSHSHPVCWQTECLTSLRLIRLSFSLGIKMLPLNLAELTLRRL